MDRAALGLEPSHRVIGFFGFLTSAKRAEVVLEAFRVARERDPRLVLLVVGEAAPNIDVAALERDGVILTGYVEDDAFPAYYSVADRLVNLRYPSAGETSGTLIRALDAGKPVAVSDYAQFAEFPNDCVVKIPLGAGEVERLADFFTADLPSPAAAQRTWLDEHATVEKTVDGYLGVLASVEGAAAFEQKAAASAAAVQTLPLFPKLTVLSASFGATITITIRNDGAEAIRTRSYGQPEYRLIAKLYDGEREVQDRWLALPKDLRSGATAELTFPRIARNVTSLRLFHALQDIPIVDDAPWETIDVR